jgi:hypothetical protein
VRRDGIDTLVRSMMENDVRPNSNVYAELGSTWRFLMRDPTDAAHALGKLVRHCGENNVLWGTDSIWYGSPQDQIQAFRSFRIADELVERHGYPVLTPGLKAKVFGLNGARVYGVGVPERRKRTEVDPVGVRRAAYRERAAPVFETLGPRTDREFEALLAERDVEAVVYAGWETIDMVERGRGEPQGRPRVKLCTWDELLGAARG